MIPGIPVIQAGPAEDAGSSAAYQATAFLEILN